MFLLSINTFYL